MKVKSFQHGDIVQDRGTRYVCKVLYSFGSGSDIVYDVRRIDYDSDWRSLRRPSSLRFLCRPGV